MPLIMVHQFNKFVLRKLDDKRKELLIMFIFIYYIECIESWNAMLDYIKINRKKEGDYILLRIITVHNDKILFKKTWLFMAMVIQALVKNNSNLRIHLNTN